MNSTQHPAYIRRSDLVSAIEQMGLDPHELIELDVRYEYVRATLALTDDDGKKVRGGEEDDGAYIKHVVDIPIRNFEKADA